MKKFTERALRKLPKLDIDQIRALILDISDESELFEIVLQSMTDGVVVLDSEHSILLTNQAAERLLPFRRRELQDSLVWDVIEVLHRAMSGELLKCQAMHYDIGCTVATTDLMPWLGGARDPIYSLCE